LAVTDSGAGLPPELLERVFEPFFTTKNNSSGMGLSMVYGFVRQSGGHVKMYSEMGQGSSVKLYFPRAAALKPMLVPSFASASKTPAPPPISGRERILVVEDDAGLRAVAVLMLRDMGYETFEAADSHGALEALRYQPNIDLVFTDVIMPNGMTGYELLREARKLHPTIKALLTSGYSKREVTRDDIEGAPLLEKPYRRQKLGEEIRRALSMPAPAHS